MDSDNLNRGQYTSLVGHIDRRGNRHGRAACALGVGRRAGIRDSKQAAQALANGKTEEGLKIFQALGGDPKAGRVDRVNAFWKLLEIYHHKNDAEKAIATTKEMIAAFPGDDELLQQVYFTQANLCWSIHKAEEAVEACHQAVAHAAGDKQQVVVIRFRAASFLHESRNFVRLYDEAAALLPLLDGDPRAADALWYLSEATWQTGRYEECLEKTRRILAEYPQAAAAHDPRPTSGSSSVSASSTSPVKSGPATRSGRRKTPIVIGGKDGVSRRPNVAWPTRTRPGAGCPRPWRPIAA